MKILFMGTPKTAVPSLTALAKRYEVLGICCQPDKPAGRNLRVVPPAVKVAAEELNIPVFQPVSLRKEDVFRRIADFSADVIVVMAYGKLLPKNILELPKHGCINAHASLLPKYRGAAPVQHALLNGDEVTGLTVMQMDEGLDTGDILLSREIKIKETDDATSLFSSMSFLAADMLVETIDLMERGAVTPYAQDNSKATSAPLIQKDSGYFCFSDDAKSIVNRVRGLCVWPVAFFSSGEKTVKTFRAEYSETAGTEGEILSLNPLTVGAKNGSVRLIEVMPAGKKRMSGTAFAAGLRLKKGDVL